MTAARARAGEGRAPAGTGAPAPVDADVLALPHTDRLYHHLTVCGDADLVTLFRHAARGPGAIPLADDLGLAQED